MADIKDDARYHVQLARAVNIAGTWLRPGEKHVFDGKTIKTLQARPDVRGAVNVTGEYKKRGQ